MSNPFASNHMADGYARSRPPVHERILDLAAAHLTCPARFALDVGCGSGVSTRALKRLAPRRAGLEPCEAMVRLAPGVDPEATFIAGNAEAVPFAPATFDLITAAGSLNYMRLELCFPELRRVLVRGGVLLVYDFSPGRSFAGCPGLEGWFDSFMGRYPMEAGEGHDLNPDVLRSLDSGFRAIAGGRTEVCLEMNFSVYVDYLLTETNVARALEGGTELHEVRGWIERSLAPVWGAAERSIVFQGYFMCLCHSGDGETRPPESGSSS